MTLVDVNILIYAEDSTSPHHAVVRPWWDALMNGSDIVALCWPVLNGFLRVATHPKIAAHPLTPAEAASKVSGWLAHSNTLLLNPSATHWTEYEKLITTTGATGNLLMDAHLAALAIENDCDLASCDADFSKFPGLRWINPLMVSSAMP
jgi:toxin-antitoxin system PIN domain toxin